jgi:hypothetical protein
MFRRNRNTSRGGENRWRVVVLLFVIPCVLSAFAVRIARAASYRPQPIVCDGIDDDLDAFLVYGLPEDTAEKVTLVGVTALPGRKVTFPATIFPRLARLTARRQPCSESPFCATRLLKQRAARPDDPDGPH